MYISIQSNSNIKVLPIIETMTSTNNNMFNFQQPILNNISIIPNQQDEPTNSEAQNDLALNIHEGDEANAVPQEEAELNNEDLELNNEDPELNNEDLELNNEDPDYYEQYEEEEQEEEQEQYQEEEEENPYDYYEDYEEDRTKMIYDDKTHSYRVWNFTRGRFISEDEDDHSCD